MVLQKQQRSHSAVSGDPYELFLLKDIKSLLNRKIQRFFIAQWFHPRLYTYADYIFPKLYAILTKRSTEWVCESLNAQMYLQYFQKYHLRRKGYRDQIRYRRFIPHQTEVDKFFRRLTEKEVHLIFGDLLATLNQIIRKRYIGGSQMRLLVDNTEYGYYGKPTPPFDIGTTRISGTRKCRLFQGHALQGCGMTLFTDFFLLRKAVYRSRDIPMSAQWLKFNQFRISYALMDREFYRAALIKRLKTCNIPIIIPAKKYPRVRTVIDRFLRGSGPLVNKYFFAQTSNEGIWQASVHVWLVVIGKDQQSAMQIRRMYRLGQLSYEQATHQLSAFFTTLTPPKNHQRWARFLTKAYKHRWNEETAFSMLNFLHRQFRYRYPVVHLAELYLRAIIYNSWQAWRRLWNRSYRSASFFSLDRYVSELTRIIEHEIKESVAWNIGYLQNTRRKKHFE